MLNNREIATLILIGVGIGLVLVLPKVRPAVASSAADLMRIAFRPKTLAVFGLFFLWCGAWIVLAWRLDLWEIDLLKGSFLIVLTVGFPVLFTVIKAKSGAEILRKIVGETVALSALLAFYLNLESFTIPGELVLQLALLVIVLMSAGASISPDGARLASCLNVLLAVIGLGLLAWATTRLVITGSERDWGATWMELALSIWLPLSMFGFFYGLAFFAAVETAVQRMRRVFEPRARRRVIVAAVLGLHLRVRWAAAFTGAYQKQVARSASFRDALTAMRAFRQQVLDLEARERERQARLTVMAGEPGTDGDGAQLDRREFDGTKRALQFVHTAQELRYVQLGNRYWDDLTDMVLQPLARYGLSDSHGIRVEVTDDMQAWRAWRRLPSGWVLGIGGRSGSRREYLYSSADAPYSWPDHAPWVDTATSPDLPADWERSDSPVA